MTKSETNAELPACTTERYEVHEWKHALAILKNDFPAEWRDIQDVLYEFKLCKSWIETPGGRKSQVAVAIDSFLEERGWEERQFHTAITVDDSTTESPPHQVDCFKNGIALEIQRNDKDPFFYCDLNNFRLRFELRVISVGVIITRCDELQSFFFLGAGCQLRRFDYTSVKAPTSN